MTSALTYPAARGVPSLLEKLRTARRGRPTHPRAYNGCWPSKYFGVPKQEQPDRTDAHESRFTDRHSQTSVHNAVAPVDRPGRGQRVATGSLVCSFDALRYDTDRHLCAICDTHEGDHVRREGAPSHSTHVAIHENPSARLIISYSRNWIPKLGRERMSVGVRP